MDKPLRIIIIGATSAIAEHCARLWVQTNTVQMVLVGRDLTRLEWVAADLKVRSPQSTFQLKQTDFLDPTAIQTTVQELTQEGPIDIVLIAQGSLPEQQDCQQDLKLCQDTIALNATSPVLFAEAFAGVMEKVAHGKLAIISSVAGDRGRKSNYVYGAAKGLVNRYAQGLQHRLAGKGVRVILIKPGPTDTPMTAHLKAQGVNLASVESVATLIVQAIEQGKKEVYAPSRWWLIMRIIQHLPNIIFNQLNI